MLILILFYDVEFEYVDYLLKYLKIRIIINKYIANLFNHCIVVYIINLYININFLVYYIKSIT
jgi:hypothetical protein